MTYTKEQRQAWDKVVGPGKYWVEGDRAYQYLCTRIKWLVSDPTDKHTVLVIGSDEVKVAFFKQMAEMGAFEWPAWEPQFFCYQDYCPEPDVDPDETVPRSCWSEEDTNKFCNFVCSAVELKYHPIAAIVLLDQFDQSLRHVDRLLKIPKWRGNVLEKHIELPVFIVNYLDDKDASTFEKESANTSPSGVKQKLDVVWADEVEEEEIPWLIPDFLPMNVPTIFTGQMASRKSTLAIDIAAALSSWRPWFMDKEDDHHAAVLHHPPALTLFAGSEDRFESTVVPRFVAAGGNRKYLGKIPLTVTCEKNNGDGVVTWESPLSIDEHFALIQSAIRNSKRDGWGVKLVIFDPLVTMFGDKNYCSMQDANDLMIKVKKLCEEEQVTVLSIAHYNKTLGLVAKDKTSGSKRIVEAHRMAWGFDNGDDSETTIITPIKANLLAKPKSYKVTTIDHDGVGVIKFLGHVDTSADEQIEAREDKGRGQRKEIKKEILVLLKDGPMPVGDVYNQLRDVASLSSLKRAVAALLDEGKIKRLGTNPKNFQLALATEAEQPAFDEVTNGI